MPDYKAPELTIYEDLTVIKEKVEEVYNTKFSPSTSDGSSGWTIAILLVSILVFLIVFLAILYYPIKNNCSEFAALLEKQGILFYVPLLGLVFLIGILSAVKTYSAVNDRRFALEERLEYEREKTNRLKLLMPKALTRTVNIITSNCRHAAAIVVYRPLRR